VDKLHLVHYADSRFEISKKRFISEAISFGIKNIHTYGPDNLPKWFLDNNYSYLKENTRGGGYWLWKFCIIQDVMSKINYGDIILYVDTGCAFNPRGAERFQEYLEITEKNDILTFYLTDQIERKWNKRDLLKLLDCDKEEILNSGQIISGIWFIKKTEENEKLIKELYEICCLKWTIDDSPSKTENYSDFIEHRHDQSVFSLLIKKYGKKSIADETFSFNWNDENVKKWPIKALRIKDVLLDENQNNIQDGKYYNKFRNNVFSQNGEDGILEQIIKELDIIPKYLCEVGADDGILFSNTKNIMLNYNAKCIMIESSPEKFKVLKNKNNDENSICINALVSDKKQSINNLDSILSKLNIPWDFDLLSIDIDGKDHDIWNSCENFKPKIVVIEVSGVVDPNFNGNLKEYTNSAYSNFEGYMYSFIKSVELFNKKGYSAVCHCGNLIYVRDDLIEKLLIDKKLINNINLFDWSWHIPQINFNI